MDTTSITDARAIFGTDLLAPEDVGRVLGLSPSALGANGAVPYSRAALESARARGDLLVFRVAADAERPLTVLRLAERFPETVDPRLLKGVGYQLKDERTIALEPFADRATCETGWRLVHRAPVPATCNLNYELQDTVLARYAESIGLAGRLVRRSAIEAVFDTILLRRAHGTRLLERAWDWSATPTADGGMITVGEFAESGLHILGYSRAVRFGTLGICPQY